MQQGVTAAVQPCARAGHPYAAALIAKRTPGWRFQRTRIHHEYWDSNDSRMVRLFAMAKAATTGTRPDMDSEHRTFKL